MTALHMDGMRRALMATRTDLEALFEQGSGSDAAHSRKLMEAMHARLVKVLREDELQRAIDLADEPDAKADLLCTLLGERYGIKGLSFGYIGNCSMTPGPNSFDDRSFRFFTPWRDDTRQSISYGHTNAEGVPGMVERALNEFESWLIEKACRYGASTYDADAAAEWINAQFRSTCSDDHIVRLSRIAGADEDAPQWTISGPTEGWEAQLFALAREQRGVNPARAALEFVRHFNPTAYWAMRLQVERDVTVMETPDGKGAQVMRKGYPEPLFGATGWDDLERNRRVATMSAAKQLFTENERKSVVTFAARNKSPSLG